MGAYRISKVKAEKAAWEWQKQNSHVELVVINPTFVVGPVLPPTNENVKFPDSPQALGTSCETFRKYLAGENKVASSVNFGWVDVRDVALMHILGAEVEQASGQRYIGSTAMKTQFDAVQLLKKNFPTHNLEVSAGPSGPPYQVSVRKAVLMR